MQHVIIWIFLVPLTMACNPTTAQKGEARKLLLDPPPPPQSDDTTVDPKPKPVVVDIDETNEDAAEEDQADAPLNIFDMAMTSFCGSSFVKSIEVPLDHNNPEGETFVYRFAHQVKSKEAPHVIYIPGGPGGSSMTDGFYSVDENLNYLYIDPRAVGCNENPDLPTNLITTEQHAADIARIIERTQLTNYLIVGSSYGTQVATVLGNMLEKMKAEERIPELPRGIALVGTVGRTINIKELKDGGATHWDQILEIHPGLAAALSDPNALPFELTLQQWLFDIIPLSLNIGINTVGIDLILRAAYLPEVYEQNKATVDQIIAQLIGFSPARGLSHAGFPLSVLFYNEIGCREVFDYSANHYWLLEQGRLVTTPLDGSPCPYAIDRPFDVKNYPIAQTPLFYFQGEFDANTLPQEAQYSFDAQPTPEKEYIAIRRGGHSNLSVELGSCRTQLFNSIASGSGVGNILDANGFCVPPNGAQASARGLQEKPLLPNLDAIPHPF